MPIEKVQLEVTRGTQRMMRTCTVSVDGFGEHIVTGVAPFDDLSGAERQQAEDLAAQKTEAA